MVVFGSSGFHFRHLIEHYVCLSVGRSVLLEKLASRLRYVLLGVKRGTECFLSYRCCLALPCLSVLFEQTPVRASRRAVCFALRTKVCGPGVWNSYASGIGLGWDRGTKHTHTSNEECNTYHYHHDILLRTRARGPWHPSATLQPSLVYSKSSSSLVWSVRPCTCSAACIHSPVQTRPDPQLAS